MTTLLEHIRQALDTHAESTYPFECCGFLLGKEANDQRQISHHLPVINSQVENQERRFLVSPTDYLHAERYAEENKLQLLGIYHSHPDHPAIPSEHDRKQAMPFFSYIIVSVDKGKAVDLRSWSLNPDFQFDEELISEYITHTK